AVFQPARDAKTASVEPERAGRVAIKVAGRLRLVEQASIDWMESQGNYLALHAGPTMHLIRRTLADFEAELDAGRFVRIHRRVIVAVDRIGEMKSLANGDATLQLIDGQQLRVSRRYRETVRKQWAGR
ncbi:MAG TPA: LytTR family DNA-binding domain-containing protein, partial [Xanthomonadaceae bacterium]